MGFFNNNSNNASSYITNASFESGTRRRFALDFGFILMILSYWGRKSPHCTKGNWSSVSWMFTKMAGKCENMAYWTRTDDKTHPLTIVLICLCGVVWCSLVVVVVVCVGCPHLGKQIRVLHGKSTGDTACWKWPLFYGLTKSCVSRDGRHPKMEGHLINPGSKPLLPFPLKLSNKKGKTTIQILPAPRLRPLMFVFLFQQKPCVDYLCVAHRGILKLLTTWLGHIWRSLGKLGC